MAITASQVKELREKTGLPMMKCKQALNETDGDMEAAIDNLRKQGLETAAKKSGRATKSGTIGLAIDGGKAYLVTIACETDFVGDNDEFKAFAAKVAKAALASGCTDVEAIPGLSMEDGETVEAGLLALIQKIGENMKIVAATCLEGETLIGYNHMNKGRRVTVVAGAGDENALQQVAMHVAASDPAPVALDRDGVDGSLLDKEREILMESEEVLAKPEAIRPKIVEGKLNRYYKENVLLEQVMLLDTDGKDSVEQYLKSKGASLTGYVRVDVA